MPPLATLAELKDRIARRSVALRPSGERFVKFAFENPHDIAFGTLTDVARQSGVSANTVLEALRLFGFDDFRSLRDVFRKEISMPVARRPH